MGLAKYLAHAGVASRRAAERLVADGRVTVGGTQVTDPARDVDASRDVHFDGRPVRAESHAVYAVSARLLLGFVLRFGGLPAG